MWCPLPPQGPGTSLLQRPACPLEQGLLRAPQRGLPRAHMPAMPRVCCAGSRALRPTHSFPASDLSSDPASRAHLPCSLQDKTWLVGVCLFILCSPSDSRDLATSFTT